MGGSTGGSTAGSTAAGATGRTLLRRSRGPVALLVALIAVGIVVGLVRSGGSGGTLDPRSYGSSGSRAVANLLGGLGVPVRVVGDLPETAAAATAGTTVLVPFPDALAPAELSRLAGLPARLVVVDPSPDALTALGLPATAADPLGRVEVRDPGCTLQAAERAGPARTGGTTFTTPAPATACYGGSLVSLQDGRVTLLGSGELLTNDRLDEQGDAALALGLLGGGDDALWLLPRPGRPLPPSSRTLGDLVPDSVRLALLQLLVAVVLLALWRARRLGRVVVEPLPVVVRASETVEGRGRLYRVAGARDRAAELLRAAARDRLARRLALPVDPEPPALVAGVAERAGREAGEVHELLYGSAPADDNALVRLADGLTALALPGPGSPDRPPPERTDPAPDPDGAPPDRPEPESPEPPEDPT